MATDLTEHFEQLIASDAPLPEGADEQLLAPLRALTAALNKSRVGARLVDGAGGRRVTLVLWPAHRPALRTMMLPFVRSTGALLALLNEGSRKLRSAEEVTRFLEEFVGKPTFKASLAHLREQAEQPVEAVLTSPNARLLVEIAADDQRRLDEAQGEVEVTIRLDRGETLPAQPQTLASAGLWFDIKKSSALDDRNVRLTLARSDAPS